MTEIWLMLAAVAAAFAAIGWLCRGISARASYARGFRDGQEHVIGELTKRTLRAMRGEGETDERGEQA